MTSRLKPLDLSQKLADEKNYEKQLKHYQLRLLGLSQTLRTSERGLLVAFEGWDAAGKGGAIKRLVERLDPRGYRVFPIGVPTAEEKRRHYLRRFWTRLPGQGQIAIFDRSWYGRVLVERVEKLATREQWQRAYEEINDFEQQLVSDGMVVIKLWLHLSAAEQLRRFQEREASPFKAWKMTPDDWRNRKRRPQYLKAVEEMLARTDTQTCPWHLIAAEYKWFARVEVLKTVVERLEQALEKG